MNSPKTLSSPSTLSSPRYKNLNLRNKQSPQELKEKMRKNYKVKVQNCRGMLMDRFRGSLVEQDLCKTLTDIYKSMFDQDNPIENDELEILEQIKNELVHEELDWWLQEYEKTQADNFDWSLVEQEDSVICPICQKCCFTLLGNKISCNQCQLVIKTNKTLTEINNLIFSCLDKHNSQCTSEPQFSFLNELNESHVYIVCETCTEMSFVV